jgi:hypothetical protein
MLFLHPLYHLDRSYAGARCYRGTPITVCHSQDAWSWATSRQGRRYDSMAARERYEVKSHAEFGSGSAAPRRVY